MRNSSTDCENFYSVMDSGGGKLEDVECEVTRRKGGNFCFLSWKSPLVFFYNPKTGYDANQSEFVFSYSFSASGGVPVVYLIRFFPPPLFSFFF